MELILLPFAGNGLQLHQDFLYCLRHHEKANLVVSSTERYGKADFHVTIIIVDRACISLDTVDSCRAIASKAV
jgi:hypothetical protein